MQQTGKQQCVYRLRQIEDIRQGHRARQKQMRNVATTAEKHSKKAAFGTGRIDYHTDYNAKQDEESIFYSEMRLAAHINTRAAIQQT